MTAKLYSEKLPKLQLSWDATSLYALSFCPRFYQLSILEGWRADTIDLDFGIMAHKAMEVYDKARYYGMSHDIAQMEALREVMLTSGSWEEGVWKPWGGVYVDAWKCKGEGEYLEGGKKTRKKCPHSLTHAWALGHAPSICPKCFGPTWEERRWVPMKPGKDREALIRTVVWWTEELKDSPITTIKQGDGKPMLEVNFQVALPWSFRLSPLTETPQLVKWEDGMNWERFHLCGYWDGGCAFQGENFVRERKTTGSSISKAYWAGFTPNMQVDTYSLVTSFIPEIAGLKMKGVLMEAASTGVSGTRFGWAPLYRSEEQNEEHLGEVGRLLQDAVRYAEEDYWPMRKSQCRMCPMKKVCGASPSRRADILKADYKQVFWNPLEER